MPFPEELDILREGFHDLEELATCDLILDKEKNENCLLEI